MEELEKEQSDFGRGFTYCLGLFLAHEWKKHEDKIAEIILNEKGIKTSYAMLFMSGAGDHMFDFEAEAAPSQIKERCVNLKEKVLKWRIDLANECTWESVDWALKEAKDILREYDKIQGFNTCKAEWE